MDRIDFKSKGPALWGAGCFFAFNLILIVFFGAFISIPVMASGREVNRPVRICIDPGHGGENLGAEYGSYTEKDMTLKVAEAMKDELEKYEDIEVYMTRTSDIDMTLQERADYANEVGADFIFSLHFNMSEFHELYGAETWVSAFGKRYAAGMDFSNIELELLAELGLYNRGTKTRLNDRGTNYYGIIRTAEEYGIPAVIIEHCHLDNKNDENYYDNSEWLTRYGKLNADAVARYYGLKSDILGTDYSSYSYTPTEVPNGVMKPDSTEPEVCSVSIRGHGEGTRDNTDGQAALDTADVPYLTLTISASDPDCRMLYYSYSLDGGRSWSERYPWQGEENADNNKENSNSETTAADAIAVDTIAVDTIEVAVPAIYDTDMNVRVRAYNLYDLYTESDVHFYKAIENPNKPEEESDLSADREEEPVEISRISEDKDSTDAVIVFVILGALALIVLIMLGYLIVSASRRRK